MINPTYIFGLHASESLLTENFDQVVEVYIQQNREDQRIQTIVNLAKQNNIPLYFKSRKQLDELVHEQQHQGVVVCKKQQEKINEKDLMTLLDHLNEPPFLLILDGVQDPHNLGACLRSADAAGVHAVIVPHDRSVGLTPIVRKVASGAAETVPLIQVTNLTRTMKQLQDQGVWLYGMTEEASSHIYLTELMGPIAIVLGAEGKGLRRLTKENCDHLLNIPMAGSVSSLNVSVATGVCLFEIVRQRMAI